MEAPRKRKGAARKRLALLTAVGACAALVLLQLPASAAVIDPGSTPAPVTGSATWFDSLGAPYGGCGLPQANLDSPHFIALNVFNTPGDYTMYNRPLPAGDTKTGMWNNGHNCGRFVQVTIGDYCTGTTDGAANSAFCRNGSWVTDAYNGATLTMIVADSCADPNGWCRDDPYHIDLAHASLNQFVKNGAQVGDMDPTHWNNRHVSWEFIPAPSYTGDINIGWLQSAQVWWPALSVSHLANGIHGVEYLQDGTWKSAAMNGDMGQSFIVGGTTSGASQFQIRVRDVNDALINNGRIYTFGFPASCAGSCNGAYTPTTYTTSDGGTSASPSASASASSSASPSRSSASPSRSASSSASPSNSVSQPSGGCTASYTMVNSWQGGFQGQVTVTAGSAAIAGWSVGWTLASGQSIGSVWNGTVATSGSAVTVTNAAWNGPLAAAGSTTFGFTANGSPSTPTLTCTAK